MDWATKRRIIYTSTAIVLIVVYSLYHFRDVISPPPTCFDGKANGLESDIDCGGNCSLMCTNEVKPLTVEWSSFIKTEDKTYDLVALVSNKNINNDATSTQYVFNLIDKNGKTIFESKGEEVSPVNSSFPIILQNIKIKEPPSKLLVYLSQNKHYKTKLNGNKTLIKVTSNRIEEGDDISRVYATIVNNTLDTLLKVKVRVVLFDENKNAVGVGETVVERLTDEEEKQIIWTWKTPFEKKPVVAEVYPIINPFTLNIK